MFIEVTNFDRSREDAMFNDGLHRMNKEEGTVYYKAIRETDGFDMPYLPKVIEYGLIQPVFLEEGGAREGLKCYADLGIAHYNKKKGTSLELVKLEKVMQQATAPFTFYITFTVKETGNDQIRTYQTKVVARCPHSETYVEFTRVKPEIKSQAAGPSETKRREGEERSRNRRGRGKKRRRKRERDASVTKC